MDVALNRQAITAATSSWHERIKRNGPLMRAVDWVFGYDFFLSYSHGDSMRLPRRIKERLEQAGVSAETQPVSGRPGSQLSDIEKSLSGDSTRNLRPLARAAQNSLPETGPLAANRRKRRLFSEFRNSAGRDRCAWLGNEDSNRDVSNSSPSPNQPRRRP
jgi:hypothetical protein